MEAQLYLHLSYVAYVGLIPFTLRNTVSSCRLINLILEINVEHLTPRVKTWYPTNSGSFN